MPDDQFNKIKNAGTSRNKRELDNALAKPVRYTRLWVQPERESSIDIKKKYPKKLTCRISDEPPLIPVWILGSGPFDFDFVMNIAAKDGKRQIRLEQVLEFEISDIHPAIDIREELYKMAPKNVQESNGGARSSPRS